MRGPACTAKAEAATPQKTTAAATDGSDERRVRESELLLRVGESERGQARPIDRASSGYNSGMGHSPPRLVGRAATAADCQALADLYGGYVRDSLATFELLEPSEEDWQIKLVDLDQQGLPCLVAIANEELVGYAQVTPWRPRSGYRFTVEDSVYVLPGRTGQGIGRRLLEALIVAARARGAKQMIAVITDSGEPASLRLHLAAGFATVGRLRQVGFKHGRWADTEILQLTLATEVGGGIAPAAT